MSPATHVSRSATRRRCHFGGDLEDFGAVENGRLELRMLLQQGDAVDPVPMPTSSKRLSLRAAH